MDCAAPLHSWLLLLFSLTYGSSLRPPHPPLFLLLRRLPSLFFFSHSSTYASTVYLLLCRPKAGDDLRLLEDGLAGELLQYCHDHQAGGSGKGRFPFPLSRDLSSRPWRWMEGMYFWSSLYHSLYIRIAAAPCVVGGNGCRCLIMSDHLLLWWLRSKIKALMYVRDHGGIPRPLFSQLLYCRLQYSKYIWPSVRYEDFSLHWAVPFIKN